MNKKTVISGILFTGLNLAGFAFAHSPMCSCYDNGDKTITCEGTFSDGSSAVGVTMLVKGTDGKVITQGKMDKTGNYTFKKPAGDYKVLFDGGPGHQIEINGKSIKK
jgi:hypothetical protein